MPNPSLPPFGDPTRKEIQRELYAQARAEGQTPTKAAEIAGYRGDHLRKPLKLIETSEMRARMQKALIRVGAGPTKVAQTVLNAMDAVTFTKSGHEIEDHRVRVQAARLAKDLLMPEDRTSTPSATTITINLPGPAAEMYARFIGATIEGEVKAKD